ncbi:MAG: hypothetical protein IJE97_03615 [Thermoguttaceae bacterium]|nr:hypothetical protein [Thermoguttaceae bacterium]MBQ7110574.1 hypothetical protein [Thermoguttaceae bacterium]
MRRLLKPFNSLYVNELRNAALPSFAIALLTLLVTYACIGNLFARHAARLNPETNVTAILRDLWVWYIPYYAYLSYLILPAYAFLSERKKGGFAVFKRFPTPTATVCLAKFSAILTLIVATSVFFAVSSFALDLYFGDAASATLLAQCNAPKDRLLALRFVAYLFCAFELFCWSAFWGSRTRRVSLAVLATGASTFAGWIFTGFVVCLVLLPGRPDLAETLRHAPVPVLFAFFWIFAYGSSIVAALKGFGLVRLAVLAIPIYGIYRQCRRQGTATAFDRSI